jgi:P4 family phage/plasmid primase-like protien
MSYKTNYKPILSSYYVKKGESLEITNTRIGNPALAIKGGSFHIPEDKYADFLHEYAVEVFRNGLPEYLTEKQLPTAGPILIDMDLRHAVDVTERQYSIYNVMDLISDILASLKKIYLFDQSCTFPIFLFEKDTVNRQEDVTKDGLHIIVGIQSVSEDARMSLRDELLRRVPNTWEDVPLLNTWQDVFDQGIMKGHTNWQMPGSRKPGNQPYKLTRVYNIVYDPSENDLTFSEQSLDSFDLVENIYQLSARYPSHLAVPVRPTGISSGGAGGAASAATQKPPLKQSAVNTILRIPALSASMHNISVQSVRSQEELDEFMVGFAKYIEEIDVNRMFADTHNYLMTLPSWYYAAGSYDRWMRVGWALRNTNNCLFPCWVAFSAQSETFQFYDIPAMYEKWEGFDIFKPNGLTLRSIMHWSRIDAPDKYKEVRKKSVDFMIELCIQKNKYELDDKKTGGCTSVDLAEFLYYLYKDRFVCVSIKANIWYEYKDHRWKQIDSGAVLRHLISSEMRHLFDKKRDAVWKAAEAAEEGPKKDLLEKQAEKYGCIVNRLGNTSEKNNIMTEARELFRDETFLEKIDENNHLICFKNGVYDFIQGIFRKGYPEDYLTLCTNIDYLVYDAERDEPIRDELRVFLSQLFPDPELCRYMTEHLASTFIGGNPNQTMNMYMGQGQNGKSVLTGFMGMVLGDYKGDVPLSLIVTRERTKIGGTAPELLALKGKRYAVMQEPSKGDVINDGIMKQITSGEDVVQARGLFQPNAISFIPAFKLVVCLNELMGIDGNSHGTWRRMRLVPFDALFTDKPVKDDPLKPHQFLVDKNMRVKFEQWKEVFAAWMVEIATQTKGVVRDCAAVLAATNSYRESQDKFSQFIAEKIMKDPQGKLKKIDANAEFGLWYTQNIGGKAPASKDLYDMLDKTFGKNTRGIWHGARIRYGDGAEFDVGSQDDVVIQEYEISAKF